MAYAIERMDGLSQVDGMEGTLTVNGRPEGDQESKIPTLSPHGLTMPYRVDKTFQLVPADGATSHTLLAEVWSPAHHLTNPEHCLEGPILSVAGRWLP